jgi:capsule polysaccharide export protein KpsE/RkpR
MKTKIILLLLVVFSLFSCDSYFAKNKFIVETISQNNKHLCTYKVVLDCSTAEKFLRYNHFDVVDSIGKFQVGDTICFSSLK